MVKTNRRRFMQMGAITCAFTSFNGVLGAFMKNNAHAKVPLAKIPQEYFYSACGPNCGSLCFLKCYTENNKVIRVESETGLKEDWQNGMLEVRACPRGRAIGNYMYAKERLKYPLRRIGKRGEGKFERISWEEAYDTIADKMKYCIENYGNASIMSLYASGITAGVVSRREALFRFLCLVGGYSAGYGDYSSQQNQFALTYMYGMAGYSGNPITDVMHSKLAVFFGGNTIETRMSGGGLQYELIKAKKENNTKIIIIDPRFSESCVAIADEWIPIRPGTDAALASAIAYILIKENMVDMDFIRDYVQAFDSTQMPIDAPNNSSYSDYILGTGYDMIAKTPAWAAPITGISEQRIIHLAREIGQAKPCYISQGWGLQRQAAGEMTTMAVAALATITGNVGIRGGNNGDRDAYFPIKKPTMPVGVNDVKVRIPCFQWVNAIERGAQMTARADGVIGAEKYPTDLKFLWSYGGNILINQHSDINHTKKVLADDTKCEMIVVMDTHFTASATWADIVLPSCNYLEVEEIYGSSYGQDIDYYIFSGAVKPYEESKNIYDVCTELAKRFNREADYTLGRTREDWLIWAYENVCKKNMPSLPATLAEARKKGIWHQPKNQTDLPIRMQAFRQNPKQNPLNTPSGKIELYSEELVELAKTRGEGQYLGEIIPPVPQYVVTWEGYGDIEGRKKYPLQMIGHHYKARVHSSYAASEWLNAAMPQTLWINPIDAKARGLKEQEKVIVYNDRGEVEIPIKITTRIMPGVISMPQGAWYAPDKKGLDKGGCINTLTAYRPTIISKANPQHTNLVEVRKA